MLAHPDYIPAMRAHAASVRQVAYLKFDTPEATDLLSEVIRLRERIAGMTTEPHDDFEVGAAHHNYGQRLATAGRFDEALNEYERARAAYQVRLDAEPGHANTLRQLSLLMKNTGAIHHFQERIHQALASYHGALEIDEAQLAKEPDSVQAKMNLTFALGSVAGALGLGGKTREAIEYHRRALAIREELSARDPANISARAAMLRSYQSIGQLQAKDDPASALATFQKARRIVESGTVRTREIDVVAAWIHAGIGDAHDVAAKSTANARLKSEHYQNAIASYERARVAFETLRAAGTLSGPDSNILAALTKSIPELRAKAARTTAR